MPDILIRMEMPKSCADCHDADLPTAIAWLEAKCPCAYGMNKPGVYDLRHKRHPDCPLVELPPHGDLIDRDAILNAEKTKPIAKMMMFGGAYVIDLDVVRDAPVVVPEEKGETQ